MTTATSDKIDQLYAYVQERCLWQFFSRKWDREENIEGILGAAATLLTGGKPPRETPMQKLFYADAVVLAGDFRTRFPWIAGTPPDEVQAIMAGLRGRITEIAVTRSKNGELTHDLY